MKNFWLVLVLGLMLIGCAPELPTPTTPPAFMVKQEFHCFENREMQTRPEICNGVILERNL
jgi:hypothetical protein